MKRAEVKRRCWTAEGFRIHYARTWECVVCVCVCVFVYVCYIQWRVDRPNMHSKSFASSIAIAMWKIVGWLVCLCVCLCIRSHSQRLLDEIVCARPPQTISHVANRGECARHRNVQKVLDNSWQCIPRRVSIPHFVRVNRSKTNTHTYLCVAVC